MDNAISIIMPLYNKDKYVGRAIRSVLNQTFTNFELVVVDDGSTDQSLNKVKEFDDKRIHIIEQRNLGISVARNTGIFHSLHQLVAFLDADDCWENIFLQTISSLINEFPQAGLYSTGYYLHYDSGTITKTLFMQSGKSEFIIKNYFKELLNNNWGLHTSSVVVRKFILEDLGMFPVAVLSESYHLYLLKFNGKMICKVRSGLDFSSKGPKLSADDPVTIPDELKCISPLYLIKSIPGEEFYLWDYIACYYPVAYSNQLLSNFFGNIPDQDSKGKFTVFCATVDNLYRQIHSKNNINHIGYIKKYMRKVLFSQIVCTFNKKTHGDLITCLNVNHADYLMPILNFLARRKVFYPIFYTSILWQRYKYSRKIFKIIPKRLTKEFLGKIAGKS